MWYGKVDLAKHFMKYKVMSCVCVFVFVFLSPDGKAFVLVNPQTVPLHTNVLQCILTRNRLPSKKSTEALVVKIYFFVLRLKKELHNYMYITIIIITCSSLCLIARRSCLASWASASLLFKCSMLLWIVPTCKVISIIIVIVLNVIIVFVIIVIVIITSSTILICGASLQFSFSVLWLLFSRRVCATWQRMHFKHFYHPIVRLSQLKTFNISFCLCFPFLHLECGRKKNRPKKERRTKKTFVGGPWGPPITIAGR